MHSGMKWHEAVSENLTRPRYRRVAMTSVTVSFVSNSGVYNGKTRTMQCARLDGIGQESRAGVLQVQCRTTRMTYISLDMAD
jgi:hypothetical protein